MFKEQYWIAFIKPSEHLKKEKLKKEKTKSGCSYAKYREIMVGSKCLHNITV